MQLSLVSEFKKDDIVYVMLHDHTRNMIYGEYKVINTEYKGLKNSSATLMLLNKPKKSRYFKKKLILKGYHIIFCHTQKDYTVYDSEEDLISYYCKLVSTISNVSPKLLNDIKNMYPQYFFKYFCKSKFYML